MAQKVFVDLDDEIVFVVEKVLGSDDNQVMLVVPESATLVSSLVSLKLLARQINRRKKLAVLVTEDKLGLDLAEKAGLVAVEKISEVTGKVWKKALMLKEEFLEAREALKRKLVNDREEGEKVSMEEVEDIKTEEGAENAEDTGPNENETPDLEEDYFQGMPEKPRIPGKLVDAEGFTMFAGGDIAVDAENIEGNNGVEEDPEDKIKNSETEEKSPSENRKIKDYEEEINEQPQPQRKNENRAASLVGRDLASAEASSSKRSRVPGREAGGLIEKVKEFFMQDRKRIYYAAGGLLLVIILFLGYFVLPSVRITVTLAEAEVPVNEEIKATLGVNSVDFSGLSVPAKKLELPKESSGSARTTGKGKTGEKAKGVIDIYNNTGNDVVLPARTPVVSTSTSRKYFTTKEVSVPKAGGPGGTGRVEDVPIEAETFGTEYNVDSDKDGVYKIGSYITGDINGQTFRDITGGTTEDVDEVSKDDFNDLRNKLVEDLQKTLFAELERQLKKGEVKIPGTESTSEPEVKSSHQIGDDTENLDMTVNITASFYVVNEDDLKDMANHLIKEEKELEGNFEVKDLNEIEVSGGQLGDGTATFRLKVKGNIKAQVDEQDVKDRIRGKEYSRAAGIIRDLPDVEKFEIDYSPSWMPIKRMPTKDNRIEVIIK